MSNAMRGLNFDLGETVDMLRSQVANFAHDELAPRAAEIRRPEVKEKSKQLTSVLDAAQSGERDVPEYIEVDHRAMRGRVLRAPKLSDVPYPVQMEPNLVVEFYSR